jgi:hypothetical protein
VPYRLLFIVLQNASSSILCNVLVIAELPQHWYILAAAFFVDSPHSTQVIVDTTMATHLPRCNEKYTTLFPILLFLVLAVSIVIMIAIIATTTIIYSAYIRPGCIEIPLQSFQTRCLPALLVAVVGCDDDDRSIYQTRSVRIEYTLIQRFLANDDMRMSLSCLGSKY